MLTEMSAAVRAPKETVSRVYAACERWPGLFRPSAGSLRGPAGGDVAVSLRRVGVWWSRESGWGDKRRPEGLGGWSR